VHREKPGLLGDANLEDFTNAWAELEEKAKKVEAAEKKAKEKAEKARLSVRRDVTCTVRKGRPPPAAFR
jgi:hypothetical protein